MITQYVCEVCNAKFKDMQECMTHEDMCCRYPLDGFYSHTGQNIDRIVRVVRDRWQVWVFDCVTLECTNVPLDRYDSSSNLIPICELSATKHISSVFNKKLRFAREFMSVPDPFDLVNRGGE